MLEKLAERPLLIWRLSGRRADSAFHQVEISAANGVGTRGNLNAARGVLYPRYTSQRYKNRFMPHHSHSASCSQLVHIVLSC